MKFSLFVLLATASLFACKSDESIGPSPGPDEPDENWDFPTDTKFSLSLFAEKSQFLVGESFYVKLVLYNISNVFGEAVEIDYDSNRIEILEAVLGPHFTPATDIISVTMVEPDSSRMSSAVAYKAGTGRTANGSGISLRIKCKATQPGDVVFMINMAKLEIRQPDGEMIEDFQNLLVEDLAIVVQ